MPIGSERSVFEVADRPQELTVLRQRLAGQRAAVVMSLVQSARLNGHDLWAYVRDVVSRLPTHLNSRIDKLLPHSWQPV